MQNKDVWSIRGVDRKLIRLIKAEAAKMGVKISDVVNDAFEAYCLNAKESKKI